MGFLFIFFLTFNSNLSFGEINFSNSNQNEYLGVCTVKEASPLDFSLASFSKGNMSIGIQVGCEDAKKDILKNYSLSYCMKANKCRSIWKNLGFGGEDLRQIVKKNVASEFGKKFAKEAESFEVMKKFAKEKFHIKAEKYCKKEAQKEENAKCNEGRFAKDLGLETQLGDRTIMEYLNFKIDQKTKQNLEKDDEQVENLAEYITSDAFKSLSDEEKKDSFLNKLKTNGEITDPVFAVVFNNKNKIYEMDKTEIGKQLVGLIKSKDMKAENFIKKFNGLRKSSASALLQGSRTCSNVSSFEKACQRIDDFKSNNNAKISQEKADSFLMNLDAKNIKTVKDEINALLEKNGESHRMDDEDVKVILNAEKCDSFSVQATNASSSEDVFDVVGETIRIKRDQIVTGEIFNGDETVISTPEADFFGPIDMSKNKMETEENQALSPSSNVNSNEFYERVALANEKKNEKEKASAEGENNSSSSGAQGDKKLTEAERKLAEAEENLKRLKIETQNAEESRARQKKIDEEEALVFDLKKQISDLKNEVKKTKEDLLKKENLKENPSEEHQVFANQNIKKEGIRTSDFFPTDGNKNSVGRNSQGISSFENDKPSEKVGGVRQTIENPATSSESLRKPVNLESRDGILLTSTSSIKNETIANKILEMKGAPFLIEEGNMIKEIITVLKDGKIVFDKDGNPLFEKIVKGKKVAKKVNDSKSERLPGSVTTLPDLRRLEEEAEKKMRYLDLLNLTKKVLSTDKE